MVYTVANLILAYRGARHRKRSGAAGKRQKEAAENPGNGLALALGALLDGIPKSIVTGVSLIQGGSVGLVAVAAVFLSNLPEGLSSAAGLKVEGKSASYTFALWTSIALVSGISSLIGYAAFARVDPAAVAFVQALAEGAILAMIVDTMVPKAFEGTHDYAGLISVGGFLTAFASSKLG